MKILLINKLKTGFTEKYAKWISEEIDCEVVNVKTMKKQFDNDNVK